MDFKYPPPKKKDLGSIMKPIEINSKEEYKQ